MLNEQCRSFRGLNQSTTMHFHTVTPSDVYSHLLKWCSKIGSLMSLDAPEFMPHPVQVMSGEPISLHKTVLSLAICCTTCVHACLCVCVCVCVCACVCACVRDVCVFVCFGRLTITALSNKNSCLDYLFFSRIFSKVLLVNLTDSDHPCMRTHLLLDLALLGFSILQPVTSLVKCLPYGMYHHASSLRWRILIWHG